MYLGASYHPCKLLQYKFEEFICILLINLKGFFVYNSIVIVFFHFNVTFLMSLLQDLELISRWTVSRPINKENWEDAERGKEGNISPEGRYQRKGDSRG